MKIKALFFLGLLLPLQCLAADSPALEKTHQQQSKEIDVKSQTKVLAPSEQDVQKMADAISFRLKQTIKNLHIDDNLCCEIRFRVGNNKNLVGYTFRALPDCETFNAAVFQAIYLACKQHAQGGLGKMSSGGDFHFFITRDQVYLRDPHPEEAAKRRILGPLFVRDGRQLSDREVELIMQSAFPRSRRFNDIRDFLDGKTNRYDGIDNDFSY